MVCLTENLKKKHETLSNALVTFTLGLHPLNELCAMKQCDAAPGLIAQKDDHNYA